MPEFFDKSRWQEEHVTFEWAKNVFVVQVVNGAQNSVKSGFWGVQKQAKIGQNPLFTDFRTRFWPIPTFYQLLDPFRDIDKNPL